MLFRELLEWIAEHQAEVHRIGVIGDHSLPSHSFSREQLIRLSLNSLEGPTKRKLPKYLLVADSCAVPALGWFGTTVYSGLGTSTKGGNLLVLSRLCLPRHGDYSLASMPLPGAKSYPMIVWQKSHFLNDVVGEVVVISLPTRNDRRRSVLWNFASLGIGFRFHDAVRPNPDGILWREMRNMEAYNQISNLRGDYVIGAVGCKRSVMNALKEFLETKRDTLLIAQDDCELCHKSDNVLRIAWSQLPTDWDMLYLGAKCVAKPIKFSSHLVSLIGARHCTAIVFNRRFVEQIMPELSNSDTELDVFLEQSHRKFKAFCVCPMVARQAPGFSDITQRVMCNSNSM